MSLSAYLGIDVGTSGIRGCCIDDHKNELVNHQISFSQSASPKDNSNERDPNIWLILLDKLLMKISSSLQNTHPEYSITAISIDGTSSTLIACTQDGTALSPALMYNDQQGQQEAKHISQFAPSNSAVHGASSSLAKALLLLKRYPKTKIFCHQADWLSSSLTGQYGISDENNCLKLGYNSVTQSWPTWLHTNNENMAIPINLLPKVVAPGAKLGKIKVALTNKYKLDKDCHIIAGTTDSNAAVLATGANKLGDAVTSLGSTLVIKLFTDKPLFNPEYGIYSHRLNGHWLVGGASNSGGCVLRQHFSQSQLDAMTTKLNPNKLTGLNYYPLPRTGERFPENNSTKESRITPRPESDIAYFQGLLEGIANIEHEGYNKLLSLGTTRPQQIFTAGGGSNNLAWQQIRERICGIKVTNAIHSEACYGSALLARQGDQHNTIKPSS